MTDPNVLTLGERLEVEAAIDAAFEPLRDRHTDLSPLRVRAAVRWGRGVPKASPQALRWSGAIARLSELSVAVGMSVVIFGAALGPAVDDRLAPELSTLSPSEALATVSIDQEDEIREIREARLEWLRSVQARLKVLRSVPLNDWLDPTIVRPAQRRLDLPTARTGASGPTPY